MENGDIIQLEYEGWIAGSDELFDTSKEDLARKNEIHDEERTYGPMYTVVGAGRLIKGLEDHLLKAEVDKDYELEIPPEDAYGDRDPKNVETHSMRELARLKIEPEYGKTVTIRNKHGWISGLFAGRVRVDYNHKLAGKTLRYKYKVVGKAEGKEAVVRAIIAMDYGRENEFELEVEGDDTVNITLPDVCKYDPNWTMSKLRLVNDLREIASMVTEVMREVYVKREAATEGEAPEEAPAEGEATEETPAEGEAAEETPAEGEGVVETHAEEAPAEEAPAEEAPAEEAPAEDAPEEKEE